MVDFLLNSDLVAMSVVNSGDPKHTYALGVDVGTTSVKIAVVRLAEEEAAVQIAFHAEKNTDVRLV